MTNPAGRRYLQRFIPSILIYVVLLIAAIETIDQLRPRGLLLAAIALLPALPLIAVLWAIGMFIIEQKDEYLRMRQVRQALVATGFTLAACTIWGFLEMGGAVPHIPLYWAFIIWCFGLFLEPLYGLLVERGEAE